MYIGTLVLDKEMIGQDGGGRGASFKESSHKLVFKDCKKLNT